MTAANKVLIVSGGIDTELIDRDPEWRAVGTGITITGPTFRAFGELGVEAEVRASGRHDGSRGRACPYSELLVAHESLEATLANFVLRRFERCRTAVENSATLGRFELEGVATETHKKLQTDSWQAMAAPI